MNAPEETTTSAADQTAADETPGERTPAGETRDASPPESPDGGFVADKGDGGQRGDVLSAMAVYSSDGQADDASGNDAAQALMQPQDDASAEPDRMPHGPDQGG